MLVQVDSALDLSHTQNIGQMLKVIAMIKMDILFPSTPITKMICFNSFNDVTIRVDTRFGWEAAIAELKVFGNGQMVHSLQMCQQQPVTL